jgi:TolB-like protein/Tfp pilus assembly protein PilF
LAAAAVFLAFYIPGRFEVEVREDISIAVLPFVNMSSDPDQEYFSDGISEELINLLATIPELKVISRTSAFSFKGRRVDISTIAEELKVSHIVEGSVRTDGNRIRITAQLVDAHSDDHLWSQTYDRDFEEIFAIQDEIARHVVDNVRVMLQGRYPRSAPADPEAYRLYLLGRFNVRKWTPQSLQESLEYFQKSIAIDPEYAPAYVGLASYYGASSYFGYMPSREANERKLAILSKALHIDPDLAEVHRSFAGLDFYFNWDWEKAEKGFRRAISLNPNYADAYQTFAWYLTAMGRFEEALEMARKASELEPLSENMHMTLSNVFYMSGNPDEAISSLKIALALNPHKPMILAELGWCYVQKEMFTEAVEYTELALASSPGDVALLWMLGHAYAVGGDHDRAREILARLHALDQEGYVMPWAFAIIHVGLGETEISLDWLEKSFQSRDNWMVYAGVDPRLDPLRSEPRFQDLLERLNYPD